MTNEISFIIKYKYIHTLLAKKIMLEVRNSVGTKNVYKAALPQ